MKAFLEEYGLIIVAIIIVAALIALAIYFKTTASNKAKDNFDTFTGTADLSVAVSNADTDGDGYVSASEWSAYQTAYPDGCKLSYDKLPASYKAPTTTP